VDRHDPACESEAYLEGVDVPEDFGRAMEIGEKAAEEGDPLLQSSIGFALLPFKESQKRGFDWIVKGAREGCSTFWIQSLLLLQVLAHPVVVLAYLRETKSTYENHAVLSFMAYSLGRQMEGLLARERLEKEKNA
jgi:hypothetical protein